MLVAEDNVVNQKVINALLRRQGWSVTLAGNGRLACESLRLCEAFDLVLMDVQMPEMDGLEATGWIRQREQECACRERVPIVALTAHASQAQHQQCLAAGMDAVVTKPIDMTCAVELYCRGASNQRCLTSLFQPSITNFVIESRVRCSIRKILR